MDISSSFTFQSLYVVARNGTLSYATLLRNIKKQVGRNRTGSGIKIVFYVIAHNLNVPYFRIPHHYSTFFAVTKVIVVDIDLMEINFVQEHAYFPAIVYMIPQQ